MTIELPGHIAFPDCHLEFNGCNVTDITRVRCECMYDVRLRSAQYLNTWTDPVVVLTRKCLCDGDRPRLTEDACQGG